MTKIAITGAPGRMGRELICALAKNENTDLRLAAAVHKDDSDLLGVDAGELADQSTLGVRVSAQLGEQDFDLLIDFTLVEPSMRHLDYCRTHGKPMVIGTTGFNEQQITLIEEAAKSIPIVLAPNMSVGVNLCLYLLSQAASVLGAESDIEISETHHRHKVDAPSGTALKMGEVVAQTLRRNLADCAVYSRDGEVPPPRERGQIAFTSIRTGDVVGDHTVSFAGEGERIELSHKASNRQIYALGALRAARWLIDQPPGLYDMQDVLNLRKA